MKVYIFNEDFTNQSIRQMKTISDFVRSERFFMGNSWNKYLEGNKNSYMNLNQFLLLEGEKAVMFFSILDGLKLLKLKKQAINLIFRPRGIAPEESFYRNNKRFNKVVLDIIEHKVLKRVDSIIFLNNAQKEHYKSKYINIDFDTKKTFILPNIIRNDNELTLNEIKRDGKSIRIVYSGGFSKWQNIDHVFSIVNKIVELSEIKICFTVLTFKDNFEQALLYAKRHGLVDIIKVMYVEPSQLNNELQNHDIGIIIRDDNIVNRAASPFKIIDYISNGLGLIISNNFYEETKEIINHNNIFILDIKGKEVNIEREKLEKFLEEFSGTSKRKEILFLYDDYIKKIPPVNL